MKKKKVVIALGGNALGKNVEEQKEAVAKTAKVIVDLASQGLDIIITHGNGPQVGMIQDAMDSLVVQHENYKQVPLPTCVAMSQGYIGIDLQNAIKYELYSRGIDGKVSTILSQVEVDEQDPAFQNPTKPIGRFLTKEEAEKNMAHGISCMEDAGRGYRIVVPSPMPKRIRELETIRTLVQAGHIVITCGGGGIPVVSRNGRLEGVNAVIDKDNASKPAGREAGCRLSGDSDGGRKGCYPFWKGRPAVAFGSDRGAGRKIHGAGRICQRLYASEDRGGGTLCQIRGRKKYPDYSAG